MVNSCGAQRRASRVVGGLRVCIHDVLPPLETIWKDLVSEADCYVFQTWEWHAVWFQCVGQPQEVQLRIIQLLDSDGVTLALWPLCIYRRANLRVLGFMGDPVSDYRAPILSTAWLRQVDSRSFRRLWAECIGLIRGVDLVWLDRMPARFAEHVNPMVELPRAAHRENAYFARLPATVQAYRSDRSKKTLAGNRRETRRLQERGRFVFTSDHSETDWEDVFAALVRQKSRRWRETGSVDLFAKGLYVDFYRTLSKQQMHTGFVTLCSIRVDETVVAAHWGLRFRNRYYWILPSFETGPWKKYSSGRILLQSMIEWSIDEKMACFDLTVGDEGYKKVWCTDHMPLYHWRCARTPQGWAYLAFDEARAWARTVPPIRAFVRWLKAGALRFRKAGSIR